ncbi:MAG: hypothetical protein IPL41_05385 [Micropruina sp.]|nr:hypothetical protein [Micropruina sp.]
MAVVIGSKRWPKALEQAASPAVRRLRAEGRLFCLPTVPGLAMAGLTPEPLPAAIVAAASDLVTFWKGTRS